MKLRGRSKKSRLRGYVGWTMINLRLEEVKMLLIRNASIRESNPHCLYIPILMEYIGNGETSS